MHNVELQGGELAGGELIMASKNAALLLTELGFALRLSAVIGCTALDELLVLQLLPDC